jgi:hypothetical protein
MTDIPKGYGLIPGRGRATAQAALAAAAAAKVDPSLVRTTLEGYLVPEKALKEYEKTLKSEPVDEVVEEPAETEPIEEVKDPPKAPAKKTPAKKTGAGK